MDEDGRDKGCRSLQDTEPSSEVMLASIISCHYINQIPHIRTELRSANASYMLISGCDKENYKELKDELYPFELEDLLELPRYQSMNLMKNKDGFARFITKLPPPNSTQQMITL